MVSLRSLVVFVLVGGFATAVQYVLMALFIWLLEWPLVYASGAGFAISAIVNYFLNARLTFRSKERHRRTLPRFVVTAGLGLALNSVCLAFLSGQGLPVVPAQILTTLVVLLWNYTLSALWTFKNRAN